MITGMQPGLLRLLVLLCGVLCYGCSKDNPTDGKRLEAIADTLGSLNLRTAMLESKISVHNGLLHDRFRSARLDTTRPGMHHHRVDTDLGFFLVVLDEVTPYLEGYRVSLRIGNPSMVTYPEFSLNVKWGRKFPWNLEELNELTKSPEDQENLMKAHEEWESSLQEKKFSFSEELKPGFWNRVEFIVAPAKAEQLGLLEVAMDTNALTLHELE